MPLSLLSNTEPKPSIQILVFFAISTIFFYNPALGHLSQKTTLCTSDSVSFTTDIVCNKKFTQLLIYSLNSLASKQ